MTAVHGACRPRFSRGVRLREDPARGCTVLLAPERVLRPSPTAIAILRHCDGEQDVDAIVHALAASYRGSREQIATEVRALLGELAAKGLLQL